MRARELITQDRIDLLRSWRNSGFGVHNRTTVYPSDSEGLHKLACYFMRPPVNLSRIRFHPDSRLFFLRAQDRTRPRRRWPRRPPRVLGSRPHPHPRAQKHLVRFYGVYANRLRATYRQEDTALPGADVDPNEATSRRTLTKRWAELLYRIFEVDPLECPRCGAATKILTFIIDPKVIRQILDHLEQKARPRAPPDLSPAP